MSPKEVAGASAGAATAAAWPRKSTLFCALQSNGSVQVIARTTLEQLILITTKAVYYKIQRLFTSESNII